MYKDYIYKDCVTEESARRQRQLEQCLLELMLTAQYSQITITDISNRAGISRKSFYRYFNSKEGCLYALIDHAIFDGAAYYIPGHQRGHSNTLIYERFFSYWKQNATLLDALDRNSMGQLLAERVLAYTVHEEHEFRSFFRDQADESSERSVFYISGIIGLILTWHKNGFQKPVSQMSKILADLIK